MKTKDKIIQRLLDEDLIDAEEAIILLMADQKQIQFVPYPQPYPVYPSQPIWPYWSSPIVKIPQTICSTATI